MTITQRQITSGKVQLNISITPEKYEKYLRGTALELSEKTKIPGFRPGKAPYEIIKNQIGEMTLLSESLNEIVRDTYGQALKDQKLKPAMPPKIEVLKSAPGNPLEYKAEVIVLPETVLPDLSEIKIKAREVKVEEKQVDEALAYLQKLRASKPSKDSQIELNDDFARGVNSKFKTLQDLKDQLAKNIKLEQEQKEEQRQEQEMMEGLIKIAHFSEIADELLMDVKNRMIEEMKFSLEGAGGKWEDYLKSVNKTEEELKQGIDEESQKRIKMDAIIAQIADKENIKVKKDEVELEVNRFLQHFRSIDEAKKQVDLPQLIASIQGRLLNRKVIDFLKSKVNIKN
ncbi:MAG: trigger factor [Candidatus Jacksonbacteria bacterium]